jgi:hypothetical protein
VTVGVLDVVVSVAKIEGVRLSDKVDANLKSNYTLNVSLSEKHRRPDGLTLTFGLELKGSPDVAKITVAGVAKVVGPETEVNESLAPQGNSSPPKVVETIYEKVYGLIYTIAGSLNVPAPLPNLLKKSA